MVIRIPIALLSKKQPKSDKCLRDDGCFNSSLRSSKTIEDFSFREYELQHIFHDTTDSPITPTTCRPNETVTSNQNVDIPITLTKKLAFMPMNRQVNQTRLHHKLHVYHWHLTEASQ